MNDLDRRLFDETINPEVLNLSRMRDIHGDLPLDLQDRINIILSVIVMHISTHVRHLIISEPEFRAYLSMAFVPILRSEQQALQSSIDRYIEYIQAETRRIDAVYSMTVLDPVSGHTLSFDLAGYIAEDYEVGDILEARLDSVPDGGPFRIIAMSPYERSSEYARLPDPSGASMHIGLDIGSIAGQGYAVGSVAQDYYAEFRLADYWGAIPPIIAQITRPESNCCIRRARTNDWYRIAEIQTERDILTRSLHVRLSMMAITDVPDTSLAFYEEDLGIENGMEWRERGQRRVVYRDNQGNELHSAVAHVVASGPGGGAGQLGEMNSFGGGGWGGVSGGIRSGGSHTGRWSGQAIQPQGIPRSSQAGPGVSALEWQRMQDAITEIEDAAALHPKISVRDRFDELRNSFRTFGQSIAATITGVNAKYAAKLDFFRCNIDNYMKVVITDNVPDLRGRETVCKVKVLADLNGKPSDTIYMQPLDPSITWERVRLYPYEIEFVCLMDETALKSWKAKTIPRRKLNLED